MLCRSSATMIPVCLLPSTIPHWKSSLRAFVAEIRQLSAYLCRLTWKRVSCAKCGMSLESTFQSARYGLRIARKQQSKTIFRSRPRSCFAHCPAGTPSCVVGQRLRRIRSLSEGGSPHVMTSFSSRRSLIRNRRRSMPQMWHALAKREGNCCVTIQHLSQPRSSGRVSRIPPTPFRVDS